MTWTHAYISLLIGAGVCLVALAMWLVPHEDEIIARPSRATRLRWWAADGSFMLGACAVTVAVVIGIVEIVERIGSAK